jgi:hypothetical protein
MSSPPFLEMSDEEFLNQSVPEESPVETTPQATAVEGAQVTETQETPTETAPPGSDQGEEVVTEPAEAAATTDPTGANPHNAEATGTKEGEQKTEDKAQETDQATDYEGFYKQIMAPFKANGKTIELRNPAEAVQLMQMGANYTRKMQELAPHRKVLMMLESNGLLDEGKLSYLIDLDKKNPEAIKKLIKDAGVDPMEIDTSVEPAYREGNHRVTDEEANFRTALDDMKSNQSGMETLTVINAGWDHASKELLWKSPEVMQIIHQQRESGIYDRIVTEMNRQKTLGRIAPQVPFLQAYKAVGDQLLEANGFADLGNKPPTAPAQPAVVATRAATPKPVVTNNDRANAASSTRTSPKSAQEFVNPLAMRDEDFMKQMVNRV